MKINEIEKLLGLSKANIRYYENEGLINPSRTENGYRNYNEVDVALLKKIIIYRKLGISISEIKAVLTNQKSLSGAIADSVKNMSGDIERLNASIEICEEIESRNIDNNDFDIDYFWNEIKNHESNGNKFIDIGNIDIAPFKNIGAMKTAIICLSVLFILGIAYSFICNTAFIENDNQSYKSTLPEINTADMIETVKVNKKSNLIYVCYKQATCINTYDMNGNFKWAVSIPKSDGKNIAYFYLNDKDIMIECDGEIYIYDCDNGKFIKKAFAEDYNLVIKKDKLDDIKASDIKEAQKYGITFDVYNVYLNNKVIVEKPIYVLFQSDTLGFLISAACAIALGIIAFSSKVKALNKIKLNKNEIKKGAEIHRAIYITVSALLLIFIIVNPVLNIFKITDISVGIFPATFIFIICLIANDITKKRYNNSEKKYVGTVLHYLIVIYTVTIISVLFSISFK